MKKKSGFSLIELMITVVIVGILSAIAYPSYVNYVAQSTRSDGLAAIMRVANLQEQFYLDNRQYTADMTALNLGADPFVTEQGDYSVDTTVGSDGDTMTVVATALGSQATRDSGCGVIRLTSEGVKSPSECWK